VQRPGPKPFQLCAGNPALDLVNTVDNRFSADPTELLPTYAELLRFTVQLRLLSAEQARKLNKTTGEQEATRIVAAVVALREALSAVLYAWVDGSKPAAAQMDILQQQFQSAALHRKLCPGKPVLQWSWCEAEQLPQIPLWKLAQAAADLLLSPQASLIKDCGAPTCRWLFLDVSKNHTRRWCDMKICGNRVKARRHQARLQEAPL
jgi:predicted RNA-binding Zn ribbon-like protein